VHDGTGSKRGRSACAEFKNATRQRVAPGGKRKTRGRDRKIKTQVKGRGDQEREKNRRIKDSRIAPYSVEKPGRRKSKVWNLAAVPSAKKLIPLADLNAD